MATELVLALLFGTPVLALALAVAYHAQLYLMDRRGRLSTSADSANTRDQAGASPEVMLDLRRSIEELQDQLARQRHTLHGLLSESAQRESRRELGAEPVAATPAPRATSPPPAQATDLAAPPPDLPGAVRQLTAEGLSDRAIARRLRIGLEEVRLLSRRLPEPAS